jgi:restriction system protein
MAIPDYQSIMLPLLKMAGDRAEHSAREAYTHIADCFGLTEDEKRQTFPNGRQPVIENRVGWARTYLAKAGLLESTRRGYFRITESGTKLLGQDLPRIDLATLRQFPSFVEFQGRRNEGEQAAADEEEISRTPQELLELGYEKINRDLEQEVLSEVRQCAPAFFEALVIDLLLSMGYGGSLRDAGEAIGRTGDGGIDGIIKEDRLGLDAIYVQAKRWQANVGAQEIRNFVGSLVGRNATKGVFITSSGFTRDALEYVKTIAHKVVLIDGESLARLMIEHDIGVSPVETFKVKKVDRDYFAEA